MIEDYPRRLQEGSDAAFTVAQAARSKGFDPESVVEIKPAQDIAARVEGIIGLAGLAKMVRARAQPGKSRPDLAFEMVKELCTGELLAAKEPEERLTLAIQVGLAVLTEGVLVAPTEGVQKVKLHKGPDGADYIAVLYAGPIRGAGGTGAALSAVMADYGRKILGIGPYKAQPSEVERYIEEIEIYDSRIARLQYYPSEDDLRHILENCPVCIDGMPSEKLELAVHRNVKRLDASGKEEMLSNRVRGGIGLVLCEGIAQKAKNVIKYSKNAGLDWSWLNNVIKVDKPAAKESDKQDKSNTAFLKDLVAGRPILAYPSTRGSFRLRYGRSRFTGIAAKGFSPASMIILDEFIAIGTQLRIEKPGKGCVAAPVDSIEGPFVKLLTGEAFRVNDAKQALELKGKIAKIISVGDILVTFGDFKKANQQLQPSSYVEEYWEAQLKAAGHTGNVPPAPSFKEACGISAEYGVPMHPRYIYDYADITGEDLVDLRSALARSKMGREGNSIFDIRDITLPKEHNSRQLAPLLERLCIAHIESADKITIAGDDAQSIAASVGLSYSNEISTDRAFSYEPEMSAIDMVNKNAPFKVMSRSVRIGARIGRPEKAKERLMKPAPNILFPIAESGGKERNITKAYDNSKKKFRNAGVEVEIARYKCALGGEVTYAPYCHKHASKAQIEYICKTCGRKCEGDKCAACGGMAYANDRRNIDLIAELDGAKRRLEVSSVPKLMKGVKGLSSSQKTAEALEKGILRAASGVYIFKDGTSRFDATDMPITHFYPSEMKVSVEKLRQLGYTTDYKGEELTRDDQLVEMMCQDVILNKDGAAYLFKVAKFVDELLVKYYHMEPFYKLSKPEDLVGHFVITLAPHTSAGVLCRVIGFTEAYVGFAHPYIICARRRNCDGDEDTTMLLLDALINFSRKYLPATIGGTMDAPLILTVRVDPKEVDDEVHEMEVVKEYGLEFYNQAEQKVYPGDIKIELVRSRLGSGGEFSNIDFTHLSGPESVTYAPKRSMYTKLNTMSEKIEEQFRLTDMLECVDRPDAAKKLILSHFIPDLIGNMHSFSKQEFRCVACNAKYRRIPLIGKCNKCSGKIVLTISKSSIEKYLNVAISLSERYNLEPYIRQRLLLIRDEIEDVFGFTGTLESSKQVNLSKFM